MMVKEKRKALVAEIVRLRQTLGLTQKQLAELSGVRQPVIARMETGATNPRLSTLVKVLVPMGKTLVVAPMEKHKP